MTFEEQRALLHDAIQQLMKIYQDLSTRTLSIVDQTSSKKTILRSLKASEYSHP